VISAIQYLGYRPASKPRSAALQDDLIDGNNNHGSSKTSWSWPDILSKALREGSAEGDFGDVMSWGGNRIGHIKYGFTSISSKWRHSEGR
jgi:hypothetical protein